MSRRQSDRTKKTSRASFGLSSMVIAVGLLIALAPTAWAQQTWQASVGGQSKDMGRQAAAFLPNEIWIHAGDAIQWTFRSDDIHTVSFLTVGEQYPADFSGCPGSGPSPSGSAFTGAACVSSAPSVTGQTYAVRFPDPGNYEIVCLVHTQMYGVIHVLNVGVPLPHNQAFYDAEAARERTALLSDRDAHQDHADHAMAGMLTARVIATTRQSAAADGARAVTAGVGEVAATAGGQQGISVVRFLTGTIRIHAGETVEWSNHDAALPHTITFGPDPANPGPPSANVTVDADGALHAVINSTTDQVNSGLLVATPPNQVGVALGPISPTRFRVTFTQPGVYPYQCALHDNLGMVGKVIVVP